MTLKGGTRGVKIFWQIYITTLACDRIWQGNTGNGGAYFQGSDMLTSQRVGSSVPGIFGTPTYIETASRTAAIFGIGNRRGE